MTDRYARIRQALAMGPTKGPWFHGAANGSHMYCVYDKRCWTDEDGARHGETPNMVVVVSPDDGKYANAAHIAACDPDTIRALLAEMDSLRAALEEAQMGLRYVMRVWVLADEIEWSEAEIDEAVERTIGDAKKEAGRG